MVNTELDRLGKTDFSSQVKTLIQLSLGKGQYDELFSVLSKLYKDLLNEKNGIRKGWA